MKRPILLLTILIAAAPCLAMTAAVAHKLTKDPENVVASRLEGRWRPHAALTERLAGRGGRTRAESPTGELSFEFDSSSVVKIPPKYEKPLKDATIYAAGTMTLRGRDYPFILIQLHGNPHVVYFRPSGDDPLGDAESFNLMLARAKDRANDLLFIGGDFNNQPFSAFERVPEHAGPIVPQAKPVADLLHAVKTADIDLFKSVFSESVAAEAQKRGLESAFERFRNECKSEFGNFALADFAFTFAGDDSSGHVKIALGDKKMPALRVAKERGRWKMDEH